VLNLIIEGCVILESFWNGHRHPLAKVYQGDDEEVQHGTHKAYEDSYAYFYDFGCGLEW